MNQKSWDSVGGEFGRHDNLHLTHDERDVLTKASDCLQLVLAFISQFQAPWLYHLQCENVPMWAFRVSVESSCHHAPISIYKFSNDMSFSPLEAHVGAMAYLHHKFVAEFLLQQIQEFWSVNVPLIQNLHFHCQNWKVRRRLRCWIKLSRWLNFGLKWLFLYGEMKHPLSTITVLVPAGIIVPAQLSFWLHVHVACHLFIRLARLTVTQASRIARAGFAFAQHTLAQDWRRKNLLDTLG